MRNKEVSKYGIHLQECSKSTGIQTSTEELKFALSIGNKLRKKLEILESSCDNIQLSNLSKADLESLQGLCNTTIESEDTANHIGTELVINDNDDSSDDAVILNIADSKSNECTYKLDKTILDDLYDDIKIMTSILSSKLIAKR